MTSFAKLFSKQGSQYNLYRPKYETSLYDHILAFAALPQRRLALDVATGQGQAALDLLKYFDRVIGIDASDGQLAFAPKDSPVEFRVADAHATGLPDGSADLVTVAQALHWFDMGPFYREVRRVLQPQGSFAAWTYDLCIVNDTQDPINALLYDMYSSEGQLGPYWSARRKLVDNKYRDLQPSSEDFAEVQNVSMTMTTNMTVDELVGYLSSWSAYATWCEFHPGAEEADNPLARFAQHLPAAAGPDARLRITWPITLLLARGPQPVV